MVTSLLWLFMQRMLRVRSLKHEHLFILGFKWFCACVLKQNTADSNAFEPAIATVDV